LHDCYLPEMHLFTKDYYEDGIRNISLVMKSISGCLLVPYQKH